MSIGFSSNSADDFNVAVASIGADNVHNLVTGWFYIDTTFVAGQGIWSAGNVCGLRLSGTTELTVHADCGTTDPVWTTSDAALAVDTWYFFAVYMATENTTVPGTVRIWLGTVDTPPRLLTHTNTTVRSGNYTGSATFYLGNIGTTADKAFGGHIENVTAIRTSATGIAQWDNLLASGAITSVEEYIVYSRFVEPLWKNGNLYWYLNANGFANTLEAWQLSLHDPVSPTNRCEYLTRSATPSTNPVPGQNGVVNENLNCPRPFNSMPSFLRGAARLSHRV